jgi:anti-sigma factor RsiW
MIQFRNASIRIDCGSNMSDVKPISCESVTERLTDFLEGELDPHEDREFRTHLATCSTCQQTLDELTRTINLLSRLPKPNRS